MVAGVAGTLVLPYEVHAAAVGAEVRAQFTLVDVCIEDENTKHPAVSLGLWQGCGPNDCRQVSGLPPYLYMLRCWGTADGQEDIHSGNFPRCLGTRLLGTAEDLSDTRQYLQSGNDPC